jgi:hypothetical protein
VPVRHKCLVDNNVTFYGAKFGLTPIFHKLIKLRPSQSAAEYLLFVLPQAIKARLCSERDWCLEFFISEEFLEIIGCFLRFSLD